MINIFKSRKYRYYEKLKIINEELFLFIFINQ
jgi:hypothetical protein